MDQESTITETHDMYPENNNSDVVTRETDWKQSIKIDAKTNNSIFKWISNEKKKYQATRGN